MIVRELKQEDISAVEKIFDLYWSGEFRANLSKRLHAPDLQWIVAEDDDEIVGVAAFREAPERMRKYAKTDRVVEFYVAAAKYKGRGIGTALRTTRVEQARKTGFKEAVFFSGDTHQDSWNFHDASEFKRVGEETAPDGETGQIWLMDL